MDILVKPQTTGDIIIFVPLATAALAADTGQTVSCKLFDTTGADVTASVTGPTITEVSTTGIYKLVFPSNAATVFFAAAGGTAGLVPNALNPHTIVVKGSTLTGYRAVIRAYNVDRLPGEIAKSTEIAALDTVVDGVEAKIDIVDTVVDTLTTNLATANSNINTLTSNVATVDTVVDTLTTTLGTVSTNVSTAITNIATANSGIGTLTTNLGTANSNISTIITNTTNVPTAVTNIDLLTQYAHNKKILEKIGNVWYVTIRNSTDTGDLLKRALKDKTGADITDIATGVMAQELKAA